MGKYWIDKTNKKDDILAEDFNLAFANIATDMDKKADKATTLDEYGITDAYTKDNIDSLLEAQKVDLTDYAKIEAVTEAKQEAYDYTDTAVSAEAVLRQKKDDEFEEKLDTLKSKSIPHTTASGYPISLNDHLEGENAINYRIYGNSVQNGEPTAESPVEVQSVGDLVTDTTSEYYGKYHIPVRVSRKNLLNLNRIGVSPSSLDADIVRDETSYIKRWAYWNAVDTRGSGTYEITDSGFTVNNGCGSIGFPMKIERGKTYTLSVQNCTISGDAKQYTLTATCYNANGEYIKDYIQGKINTNHLTVDTSSGVYQETEYIVWSVRRSANYNTMTVEGIQVEEGNTATSYEPYIAPVTKHIYLNEPLRKVGDYADYVDFQSQKTIRQVEVLDDTGTTTIAESFGILATPTEESIIVPELIAPNSDVMHISSGTATPPSKIDLTYYQDINKVITNLTNAILAQGGNV